MHIIAKEQDLTRCFEVFQAIFVGFFIDLPIKFYSIRMELPFLDDGYNDKHFSKSIKHILFYIISTRRVMTKNKVMAYKQT